MDGIEPNAVIRRNLARYFASQTRAERVTIAEMRPLTGGAVHRHWRVDADLAGGAWSGRQAWVLRGDGLTPLGVGLDLAAEFALLIELHSAGLKVPQPLFFCDDASLIGARFHVTRFLSGSADPVHVARANPALAEELAGTLAALQRLPAPGAPPPDAIAARLTELRLWLDMLGEARPVAEWGLRWLARNRPEPLPAVLCHGDFRTGNFLVQDGALAAVLDWEFARWSDPDEDIGWLCSRCWRFGAEAREAGGIASRAVFDAAYARASGRRADPARQKYFEVVAALRWLVIALLQRDRCLRGGEPSLDLALSGRRAAECEYELMRLTR
jgi:aminoglycoside phosphotransferase (APT) family kinase protein